MRVQEVASSGSGVEVPHKITLPWFQPVPPFPELSAALILEYGLQDAVYADRVIRALAGKIAGPVCPASVSASCDYLSGKTRVLLVAKHGLQSFSQAVMTSPGCLEWLPVIAHRLGKERKVLPGVQTAPGLTIFGQPRLKERTSQLHLAHASFKADFQQTLGLNGKFHRQVLHHFTYETVDEKGHCFLFTQAALTSIEKLVF